jgi:flagellar biosynthetic protein FlhB
VPKADVVITNPTHVAVALKYDKDAMAAPVVLAKGYDEVAQKIKAIAAEHNIPMVENIELARALAREVQVGQAIKPRWFKPVAEILAAVYKLRKGAA